MMKIRIKNRSEIEEKYLTAIRGYLNRSEKVKEVKKGKEADKWFINEMENYFKETFGCENISFREIILAKPARLQAFKEYFDQNYPEKERKEKLDQDWIKIAKETIYKNFAEKGEKKFDAYKLVDKLGIRVCPYCDRNYIFNTTKKRTCEMDHFYPKSEYPFLAICLYNLIPSCKSCNHNKGKQTQTLINPYDERYDFDKITRFILTIKNVKFVSNKEDFDFKLELKDNLGETTDNAELVQKLNELENVFDLGKLYKEHKDIVLELIQKEIIYNDSYIDELYERYEGTLFKNREDVVSMIVSNTIEPSESGMSKRPFEKLTRDIMECLRG